MIWETQAKFREICISEEFIILEKNPTENTYKERGLMQSLPHRNEN